MTTTTGTATRTGTMARYRLIPDPDPPAGTPWSCRTIRPATDAAIAVTSATGRRQGRAGRVSAVVMRAGLAGGAGLRCCQTAMTGGPASAARTAIAASGQPAGAPPPGTTPPGTTATARPAPISTP